MKIKNKKNGITLIALVITIIILLILAGITISTILGDNGIIKQAGKTKDITKKEQISEEVRLAFAALATQYYADGATGTKSDYFTIERFSKEFNLPGTITKVVYVENGNSKVVYQDNEGNSYSIIVDSSNEATVIELAPGDTGEDYLVDNVEIGDYVDIGVYYNNPNNFTAGNTDTTSALKGWRVLEKIGSGSSGKIKLISAGTPLTFCHAGNHSDGIEMLNTLDSAEVINTYATGMGFRYCGIVDSEDEEGSNNGIMIVNGDKKFGSTKIKKVSVFTAGNATTKGELEKIYNDITGENKNLSELYTFPSPFTTSALRTKLGDNWNSKYTDLIVNGQAYWLAGNLSEESELYTITTNGLISDVTTTTNEIGVRLVIELDAGTTINSSNTGDGTSYANRILVDMN